ncbi:DUF2304 domain-containing protein [Patescibacteria group bacterium]|nr:DUF2304 domain-containing protein [Patescibacteria group bacterium]
MLPQQLIALAIILIFVCKLFKQKKKEAINQTEFSLWLIFWLIAGVAIIFIKNIDAFLAGLGVSASGINFLFYIGVLILFYFVFRLRLTIAKFDRQLTDLARQVAIKEAEEKYQK